MTLFFSGADTSRCSSDEILRVTKEELELSHGYHEDSLRLVNGGYMSIMRVFHEIHCLVRAIPGTHPGTFAEFSTKAYFIIQDWIKREWNADRWEMIDHLGKSSQD